MISKVAKLGNTPEGGEGGVEIVIRTRKKEFSVLVSTVQKRKIPKKLAHGGQESLCQRLGIEINPDDPGHRKKDYLGLAILFQIPLDTAKDNYDILVRQCKEHGII